MKKTAVLIAGLTLIACNMALADSSAADQKWLGAVQKMVEQGQTKVSTSSADRVKLIQDWAQKNSYTVTVTKSDTSFKLDIAPTVAKN